MSTKSLNLTEFERNSAVWVKIEEYLNYRLNQHRIKNDAEQPDEKTQHLRGRIAEINHLLLEGQSNKKPMTFKSNNAY